MKRVIIAEKPSVARSLAEALGGYQKAAGALVKGPNVITWAVGHLVEEKMPDEYDPSLKAWRLEALPFAPAVLHLKVIADRRDRFDEVRRLLSDATLVINACDAGREGELICRRILQLCDYSGPLQRLWISSYTDAAIQEGFRKLRPGSDYEGLYQSARVRSEGDWIVGLNGTRALTVRHGGGVLLTLGRVQTPVLAGIVRREQEIRSFIPEPFWTLDADFALPSSERYRGTWFKPGLDGAEPEEADEAKTDGKGKDKGAAEDREIVAPRACRIETREEAAAIALRVDSKPGTIAEARTKSRREQPPQLFDLTMLQRIAHALFGYSAQETLKLAQELYEKHKLITYPRTDCRYISEDIVPSIPARLRALEDTALAGHARALAAALPKPGRRVVDDKKITDHHAILPTELSSARRNLGPREARLYELIGRQLIAALMPAAVWADTRVVTRVASGHDDLFLTRGKVLEEPGWRAIIPPRGADRPLPRMPQGAAVKVVGLEVKADQTRPPPRFSEASLLKFMETAGREIDDDELREAMKSHGLGTPATRAEIIEKLKRQCYIATEGKVLVPTPLGERLVALVPIADVTSPELTGQWEKRIREVQADPSRAQPFRDEIVALTERLVAGVRSASTCREEVAGAAVASGREPKQFGGRKGGTGGRRGAPREPTTRDEVRRGRRSPGKDGLNAGFKM